MNKDELIELKNKIIENRIDEYTLSGDCSFVADADVSDIYTKEEILQQVNTNKVVKQIENFAEEMISECISTVPNTTGFYCDLNLQFATKKDYQARLNALFKNEDPRWQREALKLSDNCLDNIVYVSIASALFYDENLAIDYFAEDLTKIENYENMVKKVSGFVEFDKFLKQIKMLGYDIFEVIKNYDLNNFSDLVNAASKDEIYVNIRINLVNEKDNELKNRK